MQLTRHLPAEADTLALGAAVAAGLTPGMVIYLRGELGAGKTTLARGLLQSLGVTERIKSPTYTLVEPYIVSSLYLYHFDFYRLQHPDEWVDAGFRDYFSSGAVCLVEWPDKAGAQLPAADMTIDLATAGDARKATLSADTEAGINCLRRLQT
ncbi:MAG TPA: tRNA (adenosine(37)-N6)-threonylcarbamoyltransferase complex ATPase subunit type 1 TsaE [Burkholderiales bacterium]|nr:tRNA (adenosine(37)-N6)-threonylcarbamoyltransferase complex ATPase subunit type 1 TsaE [Burkholderiales bacterium]